MSINTVNYTYGILTNNIVPADSMWYRGSVLPVQRNKIQTTLLSELWGNSSTDVIGCTTEMLIRLLRCSEYWPTYAPEYDPVNTYDNPLPTSPLEANAGLSWTSLMNWMNSADIPVNPLYNAKSTDVEKLISSVYSVLVAKDGR